MDIKFAPTLTAIGKPVGEKETQQIDKNGGTIVSSDKKLELIIPQDAVSKRTNISIQIVENTLSPGNGDSYRLEPSGIIFQKPLEIIFHYSEKEDVAMPELRNIAWQNDKGQWYRLDSCIVDSIKRTIMGNITHFSTWMWFDAFRIEPSNARLKVNKTIHPEIVCTGIPSSSGPLFTNETIPPKIQFSTYVNGVLGGDDVVGKVGSVQEIIDHYILGYYAPASVPAKNPVAVSVETNANFTLYGKQYKKLKLVSNIEIWDGWHYTFIGYSSKGCFRMIDSSSCDIRVEGNKVIVSNIINYKAWSDWPQCDAPACSTEWTNKDTWKGLVEIWGVASANFTPATQSSPAKIYISLIPAMGNTPSAKETCPKDTRIIPSMPMPAQPNYISFDITGPDEVLIHYGGKSSNVVLYNVVKGDGFVINMSD